MSSERTFLESLIRQSALNPKGSITGQKHKKNSFSSGYEMPWDFPEQKVAIITEEVQVEEEPVKKVSLALKLSNASKNLNKLKSEINF